MVERVIDGLRRNNRKDDRRDDHWYSPRRLGLQSSEAEQSVGHRFRRLGAGVPPLHHAGAGVGTFAHEHVDDLLG